MRYIDTGSRDPQQALGTWFDRVLLDPQDPVAEIRLQTGFFGSGALGYLEPTLQALSASDGPTRILVGSNDGQTPRAALDDLLTVAGPPRSNLAIGVVSFTAGYFHPKVFHFVRADYSICAYVGSANLTPPGTRSHHVEAGILLDSREGDTNVLIEIMKAVDGWFTETRGGFYPVETAGDLDALVSAGVLGVPAAPRPPRTVKSTAAGQQGETGHALYPLVAMPPVQTPLPKQPIDVRAAAQAGSTAPSVPTPPSAPPAQARRVRHWSKTLSRSDAQRRWPGNQSGIVALTQGNYRNQIDQTTYFRDDLFADANWGPATAFTGAPKEVAKILMHVEIDGVDHGVIPFEVSHAANREGGSNSPTTEVHIEPISSVIAQTDVSGRTFEIERFDDGSYWLTIS